MSKAGMTVHDIDIIKLTDRGSFYILLLKFLSLSAYTFAYTPASAFLCHLVFPDDNS